MATPLQLRKALQEAKDAASWAKEAGVQKLSVRVGDAEIALEFEPQAPSVGDLQDLLREPEPSTHITDADFAGAGEQSMDAAFGRLVSDSYGRPSPKEEPS